MEFNLKYLICIECSYDVFTIPFRAEVIPEDDAVVSKRPGYVKVTTGL